MADMTLEEIENLAVTLKAIVEDGEHDIDLERVNHDSLRAIRQLIRTPVILIGTRKSNGSIGAVGLYEDAGEAQAAVWRKDVPDDCYYSVMLPKIGQTIIPRAVGGIADADIPEEMTIKAAISSGNHNGSDL